MQGKILSLFTDGGSRNNPGQAAIGIVLVDAGKVIEKIGKRIGIATNNEAEYTALIEGLTLAEKYKPEEVKCFLDSELVVKQLTGLYRTKEPKLQNLCIKVKKLEKLFNKISYKHIPREQNSVADSLVNQALDNLL